MKRTCIEFLNNWLNSSNRKPLIIRGARQVGKTWIVRNLAEINNKKLIEINFEKQPKLSSLFSSNDPKEILLNLSTLTTEPIDISNTILFLDEIQAFPEMLAKLRWFYEDMPELAVIGAGSLLEFLLSDHKMSMPVGRINYMYLEPLSFQEFLIALNKQNLVNYIKNYNFNINIPELIHEELSGLFKEYILIGGMPEAVKDWVDNRSLSLISQIHNDLVSTYRDDFKKYGGKLDENQLDDVLNSIPLYLGQKFVYSNVNKANNTEFSTGSIKKALDLLFKARIAHKVSGSYANGLPLGAEINEKFFKVIFIDVGICSTILGLSLNQLNNLKDINLINKGGISEQVVGQLLRTILPPYVNPELYYWARAEKASTAEIDYLIQHENLIIPIEVKSGATGSLKSLHYFMELKNLNMALRINSDYPSKTEISIKGLNNSYKLISVPFYMLSEIHRLLSLFI